MGLYTSARWLQKPALGGITFTEVGKMGLGDYWTLLPPSIGIDGTWYMLGANIGGVVECTDDECGEEKRDVFTVDVNLE